MNVRITVFSGEQYDGDWPTRKYPTTVLEVIVWFQAKLAKVPADFRAQTVCEIGSAGGYEGSHCGEIEIWYDRPETDKETAQRIAAEQAKANSVRDDELAMLKALQSKYPKE